MKKITALALPLLFGAMTATAQDAPTTGNVQTQDELTTGWYQIKMTAAHNGSEAGLNKWILNSVEEHTQREGTYYSMEYGDYPTDNVERSYIYVDRNGTTTNYKIKSANGHFANYVGVAFRSTNYGDPMVSVSEGSVRLGTYWMPFNGTDHSDIYCVAGSRNAASNRYALYKVDTSGYDIYTVHFDQNYSQFTLINQPQLTCNNENVKGLSKVYDNGNFFFTSGTTVSVSDFSATEIEDMTAYITLNTTAKTISVEYVPNTQEALTSYISDAQNILNTRGVGYPMVTSEGYQTFEAAIETAQAVTTGFSDAYVALRAATTAYKSLTTGIQMPENGKAYTLSLVRKNGYKRLMYYTADGYELAPGSLTPTPTDDQKAAAVVICRDLGNGKYAFANNAGKFMIWKGSNAGENGNKGFAESCNESSQTTLIVEKLVEQTSNWTGTQADVFGYMAVKGYRNQAEYNNLNYFIVKSTGTYDQAGQSYYNDDFSSAVLIEEVENPNEVQPKGGGDIGVGNLATFSAPFATIVPENVKVYKIGGRTSEGKANLVEISLSEGRAIPASAGVLLATDSEEAFCMMPATTETPATIEINLLSNTAGSAKTITEDENVYILANGSVGVAFYRATANTTLAMNRAYLSFSSNANAIALSFGGTTTGIDTVTGNADNANAPIYDLSGRRVQKAVKGGLYIQNGRKFIVK